MRRRLEEKLIEASNREQLRVGYDLHDGICQQLAGIEVARHAVNPAVCPDEVEILVRFGKVNAVATSADRSQASAARYCSYQA